MESNTNPVTAWMEADTAVPPDFPFVIRPMRDWHLAAVMEIERQAFPSPWPESAYRYELRYGSESGFYVLQPAGQSTPQADGWLGRLLGGQRQNEAPVLGYWGVRFRAHNAHLSTIAVHPHWRGQGLGEYLLLTSLRWASRRGAQEMTLEVRASNRVAQYLYIKTGFVRTGMRPGYYSDGEDAWLMALRLDSAHIASLWIQMQAVEERLLRIRFADPMSKQEVSK